MDNKITIPLLTGAANYPTWSIHVPVALEMKDLDHCLYKTPDSEEGGDFKVPTAKENKQAARLLKLLCGKEPLEHIKHLKEAKAVWDTLQQAYKPEGFTTNYLLFKEFLRIQLADFASMDAFITKAKELVTKLHQKGWKFNDECILSWILNALTDRYEGFVANITQALRKDIKAYTLTTLCNSLLDKSRRLADNEGSTTKVMVVRQPKLPYKVNKSYKGSQKKAAWKSTKRAWCNHCKVATHNTTRCFYLFPEKAPEGWDSNRDPSVRGNPAFQKREENTLNLHKKSTVVAPVLTSPENPPTPPQSQGSSQGSQKDDPIDFEQPDGVDLFGDVDMKQLLSKYSKKQIQLANLSNQIKKIKACNTKQVQTLLQKLTL